jgi:hypothetical protein
MPILLAMAAVIATDVAAPASTPISVASHEASPPRVVMVGRFMLEPYMVSAGGEKHGGARFGSEMIIAAGEGSTRLASGLRFLIGSDGAGAFGTEGQLQVGVAHLIGDRALFALVAPLGFSLGGGNEEFAPRGYAGLEAVAAIGRLTDRAPGLRGVELSSGISTCGPRARVGLAWAGKKMVFGTGVSWQRDADAELYGLYFAATAE